MFRTFTRLAALLLLAVTMAACGPKPKPVPETQQIFDIRSVTVASNDQMSGRLLSQIKDELDRSIAATVRRVPMPPAAMTVRVVSVSRGNGLDRGRAQAEVSVLLSDVGNGQTIMVRNYLVMAFSEHGHVSGALMADTIAARLRFEYSLVTPQIRRTAANRPAISTVMSDDQPQQPQVIKLDTAPAVGADQDPLLNSRTKVAPVAAEKAKVEPALTVTTPAAAKKSDEPAQNAVEEGAKAKVVIKPVTNDAATKTDAAVAAPVKAEASKVEPAKAAPADDEICVETIEKKC
jgi:hypothetical protein